MSDTAYGIESFRLDTTREPPTLTLEGWFVAACPVQAINVVIPGDPGRSIDVTDRGRPSEGLVDLYGERARNARFRFEGPADAPAERLAEARMMVLLTNADMHAIAVGQSLVIAQSLQMQNLATPSAPPPAPAPSPWSGHDQALLARFESLGDNCEFGMVQRAVGPERLGLLRLGGARDTARLTDAVLAEFDGFAAPDDLDLSTFGTEWIVRSRRYDFTFHTGVLTHEMDPPAILRAQSQTLSFMAAKLAEDIRTGSKIFVRRVDEGDPTGGMLALHDALAAKGPATLLWVTRATEDQPHAHVEHIVGRLFRGYHGALASYENADGPDVQSWLALLGAAEAAVAIHDSTRIAPPPLPEAEPEEAAPAVAEEPPAPWWPAPPEDAPLEVPEPEPRGWLNRLLGR